MAFLVYAAAAGAEIAGCFSFWAWLRMGKSPLWIGPGMVCLVVFAWLLTLVGVDVAGRAYAAYGGIYIIASIAWMWIAEGHQPDRWDMTGAMVCLAGTTIIFFGPRAAS